jgi:hypothetical protein
MKEKKLDLNTIKESEDYKKRLDSLEIKQLWEELDLLIPKDKED